jgi:hypothetical protein
MEQQPTSAQRLRAAIASESWREARSLLPDYGRELESTLKGAAPGSPEAARLLRDARELCEWTRRMALISRAHAAARLDELERAGRYHRVPVRRSRWEMLG